MFQGWIAWYRYWRYERQLTTLRMELTGIATPDTRAELLNQFADTLDAQTAVHDLALGETWYDDEPVKGQRMTAVASRRQEANLYRLLANVETAIAYGGGRGMRPAPTPAAGQVLDWMAVTPNLPSRMRMLTELIDAVNDVVGRTAAEALWHLPAPGFSGPLTREEREEWYRNPPTQRRPI